MGFSLRKLVKQFDPTSKSSALGGVTRVAIGAIPGGSAALGAVDTFKAVTKAPTNRAAPTDRGGAPLSVALAPSTGSLPASLAPPPPSYAVQGGMDTKTMMLIGGAAVALVVVVMLARR